MNPPSAEELWSTQNLDALERANEFGRIDIDIPLPPDADADAAAGGSRGSVDFDTDTSRASSGSWRIPHLQLPIQARGSGPISRNNGASSVGCANLAQLEKALSDTAVLQNRANTALERIARQQSALKRIPVACPSCGALNVPPGRSWGIGDVVPCQECSQSFVPLNNGLQDSDLAVLRAAVHRLRAQAERIQYLEQLTKKDTKPSEAATPSTKMLRQRSPTPGSMSHMQQKHKESSAESTCSQLLPIGGIENRSSTPVGEPSDAPGNSPTSRGMRLPHPSALSGIRARSPLPLPDTSPKNSTGGGTSAAGGTSSAPQSAGPRVPVLPLPLRSEVPPAASTAGPSPPAPSHQRLMSFLDTQDLITNSSSGSATPCIHGCRLSKAQMDTEQQAREALQHLRESLPSGPKPQREEGEIGSESEPGSRFCSWDLRQMRPSALLAGARRRKDSSSPEPPPPPLRRSSPPQKPSQAARLRRSSPAKQDQGSQNTRKHDNSPSRRSPASDGPEPALLGCFSLGSSIPAGFLLKLSVMLLIVIALRATLRSLMNMLGAGDATATAVLTAVLTASCMTFWQAAEREVKTQSMLDTAKDCWNPGVVRISFGDNTWIRHILRLELTVDEAFGLASTLAHLAPVLFFENWGIYGPAKYRWGAVVGHAATAVVVTVAARSSLSRMLHAESSRMTAAGQVNEVWLGMAAGNWVASSWGAATWWRVACATQTGPMQARLPALALASAQLANFWLAQRSLQPHLLAACVSLAGLSMAACCGYGGIRVEESQLTDATELLTPAIYMAFCAVSAWLLFQELFMSL